MSAPAAGTPADGLASTVAPASGAEGRESYDIAIVGGGLAGLAAARQARLNGLGAIVFESEGSVGGRAKTVQLPDGPQDVGAQFISDFYSHTLSAVVALGLEDQLTSRPQTAFIWRDGVEEPIWPASVLLKGHGIGTLTKFRLALLGVALGSAWRHVDIDDLLASASTERRSAAEAARRTIGADGLNHWFGPLLRGLLYWEAGSTSDAVVWAILKAFAKSEQTFRFRSGLVTLAEAMCNGIEVRTGAPVIGVRRVPPIWIPGESANDDPSSGPSFEVSTAAGSVVAKSLVFATPAFVTANLFDWPTDVEAFLRSVSYSRTTMVTFDVADSADYPKGAVLFPTGAPSMLSSMNPTFSEPRGGRRLINVYTSLAGHDEIVALDDAAAAEKVLAHVRATRNPEWAHGAQFVHRQAWGHALPEFGVRYLDRLSTFRDTVAGLAGVGVAGDFCDAPYVDGAIRSGTTAVAQATRYLGRS